MTNTSTSAVPADVNPLDMSNVIDALKRLERIGSEHSQTTQKIIRAASELSDKIVSLYPEESRVPITIVQDVVGDKVVTYKIQFDENTGKRGLQGQLDFVYENREAALTFSRDVAAGLLDHIQKDLEKRLAEDQDGFPTLESTIAALRDRGPQS